MFFLATFGAQGLSKCTDLQVTKCNNFQGLPHWQQSTSPGTQCWEVPSEEQVQEAFFIYYSTIFSIHLAPSGAKYCEKGFTPAAGTQVQATTSKNHFFLHFLLIFRIYLAASTAKYCEKGRGRCKNAWGPLPQPRGVIDRHILELLTLDKKGLEAVRTIFFWLYSGFGRVVIA